MGETYHWFLSPSISKIVFYELVVKIGLGDGSKGWGAPLGGQVQSSTPHGPPNTARHGPN